MMEAYRTAYVYVREAFAGTLKETDYGYSFKYDDEYLAKNDSTAVSLTLPKREEEYTSNFLFPFFDGLIPEGWLLNVVAHNWKKDKNDRFGILLVACRDPIGNVSIREVRL
ncbi:MAG: HipA N-terminal domain-containing protein [Clostridia bacterium]|nr:HipA N-terminal domain-containing protein [Clostridia bacterium]